MRIAAVIVNYRTPELAMSCLESILQERQNWPDLTAVVVDNASPDGSAAILKSRLSEPDFSDWVEFFDLKINGGFGWGNNQALLRLLQAENSPDAFYLINPDARIEAGAIAALVQEMELHRDAAAVGSQLVNEDGTLAGSAFRFPSIGREWARGHGTGLFARILGIRPTLMPYDMAGAVDWVTGASVLIRADALREAGLFDTGFFLYFEEVELMHRFQKCGWKVYHCPESRVIHLAGASTGVVDGKSVGKRASPDYVFTARRRYFALTSGHIRAILAGLAWLFGDWLGRQVARISSNRTGHFDSEERKALIRIGIFPIGRDSVPAVTGWRESPGLPPAWMK